MDGDSEIIIALKGESPKSDISWVSGGQHRPNLVRIYQLQESARLSWLSFVAILDSRNDRLE
jgi:hypothetical protein